MDYERMSSKLESWVADWPFEAAVDSPILPVSMGCRGIRSRTKTTVSSSRSLWGRSSLPLCAGARVDSVTGHADLPAQLPSPEI